MLKTGGCNCGQIRYQVNGEPLFVHVCYCTECQRDSGGAFNMTLLLLETDFQIIDGKPSKKIVTRKSGKQYQSYFCDSCGNPIYGMPVDSRGVMVLRPGSLDDTSQVRPQAHIWVQEKPPWIILPADVPYFDKEYDLKAVWPQESLRRIKHLMPR